MHSYTKGLLCSTAAAALMASAPAQANDMNEVRAELQNLLDRMERIEQSQSQSQVAEISATRTNRTYIRKRAPQLPDRYKPYDVRDLYIMPETARANGVVGGDLPGSFKVPGSDTSVAISGWLTMGTVYDGGTSEGNFATWGHAGLIQPDGAEGNGPSGELTMETLSNGISIATSSESDIGTIGTNILITTDQAGPVLRDILNLGGLWAPNANMTVGNWTFGQQGLAFGSGACYGEAVNTGGAPCPLGLSAAVQYAGSGGGMDYRIQLVTPQGVLDGDDEPQWWLEGASYPIRVLDPERVRVLIRSGELGEKYGECAVAVVFEFGKGEVFHMISHYYLQRTELRNDRHAMSAEDYASEKGVMFSPAMSMMVNDLSLGEVEAAATSARLFANIVATKKQRNS